MSSRATKPPSLALVFAPIITGMSCHIRPHHHRKSTVTIPRGVGPHTRLVFAEIRRQGWKYDSIDERSGVMRATIKAWRRKNVPSLQNLEAVLGVLGFDFLPVPRPDRLPPALVAELERLGEAFDLTMGQTWAALVDIAAAARDRNEQTRPDLKIAA